MFRLVHMIGVILALSLIAFAQDQPSEVPLGDVARAARRSKPTIEEKVIDNDNFSAMMDKAESARLNGQPVFSIDPMGRTFRMTSPDGVCSLSFDAKSGIPSTAAYIASDLPRYELLKLEGPAAIHDDELQVSVHNGTDWELKEIVVGITVLQSQSSAEVHPAKLVTADDVTLGEKLPDMTVLYHLRGSGVPDSTSVFSGTLGGDLSDTKDWHWAIVSARGIPPASTPNQVSQPIPSDSAPVIPSGGAPPASAPASAANPMNSTSHN